MLYYEDDETLEQVPQRDCGCIQGQGELCFEQSGLMEGAHGSGVETR